MHMFVRRKRVWCSTTIGPLRVNQLEALLQWKSFSVPSPSDTPFLPTSRLKLSVQHCGEALPTRQAPKVPDTERFGGLFRRYFSEYLRDEANSQAWGNENGSDKPKPSSSTEPTKQASHNNWDDATADGDNDQQHSLYSGAGSTTHGSYEDIPNANCSKPVQENALPKSQSRQRGPYDYYETDLVVSVDHPAFETDESSVFTELCLDKEQKYSTELVESSWEEEFIKVSLSMAVHPQLSFHWHKCAEKAKTIALDHLGSFLMFYAMGLVNYCDYELLTQCIERIGSYYFSVQANHALRHTHPILRVQTRLKFVGHTTIKPCFC